MDWVHYIDTSINLSNLSDCIALNMDTSTDPSKPCFQMHLKFTQMTQVALQRWGAYRTQVVLVVVQSWDAGGQINCIGYGH